MTVNIQLTTDRGAKYKARLEVYVLGNGLINKECEIVPKVMFAVGSFYHDTNLCYFILDFWTCFHQSKRQFGLILT